MKKNNLPSIGKIEPKADLTFTQEDVVKVAVSEVEEALYARRDQLIGDINTLEHEIQDHNKKMQDLGQKESEKAFSTKVNAITKALTAFTGKKKYDTNYDHTFNFEEKTMNISSTVAVIENGSRSSCVRSSEDIAISKTIMKEFDFTVAKDKQVHIMYEELCKCKDEIRNMGRHERKAHAALSQAAMSQTAEGKSLLSEIRANVIAGDSYIQKLLK